MTASTSAHKNKSSFSSIELVATITIIIVIIELKAQFEIFTISSLRCKLSVTLKWPECNRVLVTCNTPGAYHVQHVMCQMLHRDSSVIKFDRVYITFILALFYWLKPGTNEGGQKTGVSRENSC